jgi:hypothetical protein
MDTVRTWLDNSPRKELKMDRVINYNHYVSQN